MDITNAIDEIWRAFGSPDLDPDEFTVSDLAEQKKVSYDIARRVLDKAVQAGRLTRRKVGARGWAYKYVQEET